MVDLNIPFLKKKTPSEPSMDELRNNYVKAQSDFLKKLGKVEKNESDAARLAAFGLINKKWNEKAQKWEYSGQERYEKFQHRFVDTEFPQPEQRWRMVLEYPDMNIEQMYYWFHDYLTEAWGFDETKKLLDNTSSSVSSSNFGNIQTRLGAQQGQASQYLKGVSEMVKGLFQIVRELRVLDERLQYYYDIEAKNPGKLTENQKEKQKGNYKNRLSSDIVLKGLWVDQVEGGAKNPGSVYGLSQTIGFTILPDLFFRTLVVKREQLETVVDSLKYNEKVKEVLKRKISQYITWREMTKQELENRRMFEIRYLRQHYDTIKLYMSWVKPYLRNVKRLMMYEKNMKDAQLINAFETEIIELETLFIRNDFGHAAAVVSLHIFFRVKPELSFHSHEYQHKGPIHTGMADVTLRAYAWDHKTIHKYEKYRNEDDLDLMSSIDQSVMSSMDALGDDLKRYLREADPTMIFPGEEPKVDKEEEAKKQIPGILDPFVSIFKGFAEIGSSLVSSGESAPNKKKKAKKKKKKDAKAEFKEGKQHHAAAHYAQEAAWEAHYRYRMGPGGNIYWVE